VERITRDPEIDRVYVSLELLSTTRVTSSFLAFILSTFDKASSPVDDLPIIFPCWIYFVSYFVEVSHRRTREGMEIFPPADI